MWCVLFCSDNYIVGGGGGRTPGGRFQPRGIASTIVFYSVYYYLLTYYVFAASATAIGSGGVLCPLACLSHAGLVPDCLLCHFLLGANTEKNITAFWFSLPVKPKKKKS